MRLHFQRKWIFSFCNVTEGYFFLNMSMSLFFFFRTKYGDVNTFFWRKEKQKLKLTIKIPYSSALTVTVNSLIWHQKEKSKVHLISNKHPKQRDSVPKTKHQTHQFLPLLLPTTRTVCQLKSLWKSSKKASIIYEKKLNFWKERSLNLKARSTLLKQLTVFSKQKSTTKSNIRGDHALLSRD